MKCLCDNRINGKGDKEIVGEEANLGKKILGDNGF